MKTYEQLGPTAKMVYDNAMKELKEFWDSNDETDPVRVMNKLYAKTFSKAMLLGVIDPFGISLVTTLLTDLVKNADLAMIRGRMEKGLLAWASRGEDLLEEIGLLNGLDAMAEGSKKGE